MHLLILILSLSIFSSSVTANEEAVASNSDAVVTLEAADAAGNYREWNYHSITAIDGVNTRKGFFSLSPEEVKVPPGEHAFDMGRCEEYAYCLLVFKVESGRKYTIKRKMGQPILVEMLDAQNSIVDQLIGAGGEYPSRENNNTRVLKYTSANEIESRRQYEEYVKRYRGTAWSIDAMKSFISQYQNNDPDNLVESVKQALQVEMRQEEQTNREKQKLAKEKQKLAEARQKVIRQQQERRSIGDKVCFFANDVTGQELAGGLFGQPEFYQSVRGSAQITAFVEGMSKSKLQLRITGLLFTKSGSDSRTFAKDQLDNYNGSTLKLNSTIWDSTYNWVNC